MTRNRSGPSGVSRLRTAKGEKKTATRNWDTPLGTYSPSARANRRQGAVGRGQRAGVRDQESGRQESVGRNQSAGVRGQKSGASGQIHAGQWQFLTETAAIRRKSKLSKGMESPNPKSLIKKGLRIKPAAFLPPLPVPILRKAYLSRALRRFPAALCGRSGRSSKSKLLT